MISVTVVDEQPYVRIPKAKVKEAVRTALESAGLREARMTVALIDDAQIRQLNRQFLHHDEPTDVLSFPMGQSAHRLEGEIAVSAQRAALVASQYGWMPEEELLLYIIHGALHLAGFDDTRPKDRQRMRRQEALCLQRLGVAMPAGRPKGRHTRSSGQAKSAGSSRPNPSR